MKLLSFKDKLIFDDGTVIEDEHEQDCCENVYADFNQLEGTDVLEHDFKTLDIEGVKDSGFRIDGYFIPCYNQQNGYYSGDLSIITTSPDGIKHKVDISEFVKQEID